MKTYHILSLGAGVQSTALYLLSRDLKCVWFDVAIFADTGSESNEVYKHLHILMDLAFAGPKIYICRKGNLGEDLLKGQNSTGQRFASIPAFTKALEDKKEGRLRRQCTKEYKIEPIWKAIREQVVGLKPRQRWPKDVHVIQYFGISMEEARRAKRIQFRAEQSNGKYTVRFPLLELGWTRADCQKYASEQLGYEIPRSACVFCPYKIDDEWALLMNDPQGWQRAVQIDQALRKPGLIVNRGVSKPMYLHRSCTPLIEYPFMKKENTPQVPGFTEECEGMCGV